ncbi:hypothetical protein ACI77O_12130 [Pseudomonas tritici]|uniref:hypothetical protein n=1 Tax=Pseudomonas tritici TaxID=2745518 RepID=UPI00387B6FAE
MTTTAPAPGKLQFELQSSEHGYRDYDVVGHPVLRRAKVPLDVLKDECFNVYFGESSKTGVKWLGSLEKSLLVWLTINSADGVEDASHPFTKYCLTDAVALANDNRNLNLLEPVTSIQEARDVIRVMANRAGCNWQTGMAAMDVLDAAIDKRDLMVDSRYR